MFVTLCTVACSWLGVKIQEGRKQKAAVEKLNAKGWEVIYDYQVNCDGNRVQNATLMVPQWLRNRFGDDYFTTAVWVRSPLVCWRGSFFDSYRFVPSDEDLRTLMELRHLKFLGFREASIDHSTLKKLQKSVELQELYLSNTGTTDADLQELQGFPNLRLLALDFNEEVTDDRMPYLLALKRLETLRLCGAYVHDKGLLALQNLMTLKQLAFLPKEVSDEAVAKFKQAVPNCAVQRSPWDWRESWPKPDVTAQH